MFDSLREAEERRKRKAGEEGSTDPKPPRIEPLQDLASTSTGALPEQFSRELGMLRNSMEAALKSKEHKAVLFSSSTREEGATTVAVNFARMLAQQGNEKVLLCELNSRNPAFADLFGDKKEQGICELFSGGASLQSVVSYDEASGMHIAHIGNPDPALIQLRLATVFPKLIESALEQFTTVIFDTPPITSSPETAAMSRFVDGVVLVVQSGRTKREIVQRSINAITQLDGNILGIVLNRKKYYIPGFLYDRV